MFLGIITTLGSIGNELWTQHWHTLLSSFKLMANVLANSFLFTYLVDIEQYHSFGVVFLATWRMLKVLLIACSFTELLERCAMKVWLLLKKYITIMNSSFKKFCPKLMFCLDIWRLVPVFAKACEAIVRLWYHVVSLSSALLVFAS